MRLSTTLLLFVVSVVLAQNNVPTSSPVVDAAATSSASAQQTARQTPATTADPVPSTIITQVTSAPSSDAAAKTDGDDATPTSVFRLTDAPIIAGYGIPDVGVPDTAGAPFMQKSKLPDGTVFICVGAALGFFGASILLWRTLVAWSLHRSVKRATQAQTVADMKAMSTVPGKKRGMYNVVGASSNMSLDHLSAAPPGTSRAQKPFAANPNSSTPPKSTSSLFFSPTAGGASGLRDSVVNRSSNYLPAGYYAAGNSQPAQGSPVLHVGGQQSTHSLATPGNRYSTHHGISPPISPSLPPSSRGYDRAPPSRDGLSMYNRNSVATLGTPRGIYGHDQGNISQMSLNVPGGTAVPGGRAPSTYLEDLFENHGNGPKERF